MTYYCIIHIIFFGMTKYDCTRGTQEGHFLDHFSTSPTLC